MPAWLFTLLSRETFGWPSLPTLAAFLPLVPLPPTAVAPLLPRRGVLPAGPRPALPEGAEGSVGPCRRGGGGRRAGPRRAWRGGGGGWVDLLRPIPPRIGKGPAPPRHSQARGGAPAAGRGLSG